MTAKIVLLGDANDLRLVSLHHHTVVVVPTSQMSSSSRLSLQPL